MKNVYCIRSTNVDCVAFGEVVQLMVRQACISARHKSDRWKMNVYDDNVCIRFLYKADALDFSDALEEMLDEIIAHHDLVTLDRYDTGSPNRIEMYLMPASSLRLI